MSHSPTVLHRPAVFHLSQQLSTQWGLEADKVSSLEASIIAFACIKEKVLGNLLDFDSYISSIRRKKKRNFHKAEVIEKKVILYSQSCDCGSPTSSALHTSLKLNTLSF